MKIHYSLECVLQASLSSLVLIFASKARDYLREAHFRYSTLDLPTNIRLGWKGLPGTNILPRYEDLQITGVKSLITLAPDRML